MTAFHDNEFDDATQLKLELFRGYIREWLPVFLANHGGNGGKPQRVNIYDFFAGPGKDAGGKSGSPVIVIEELEQFYQTYPDFKTSMDVRMVFNDVKQNHITQLRDVIDQMTYSKNCGQIEYTSQSFQDAMRQALPDIQHPDTANLIIIDPFGVKEVTPDVIRQLAECNTTDILFFISSSYIRRFIKTPEIGGKFDMDADEVKTVDYKTIHRYVCRYFQEKLQGHEYYLAPFSIKKGPNIYGVVFGSNHLLGLEKFLKVCWALDSVTGEANYNIDGDFAWKGPKSLFAEHNVIRKVDLFEHDLGEFIASDSPDNQKLYEFCLVHGFSPKKAGEVLKTMQMKGELVITEIATGNPARRGAFYINWDNHKGSSKVRFAVRSR